MAIASVSMGYAKKTISKANIAKELVSYFLNNHLWYIGACAAIWMAILYNSFYLMYLNSFSMVDPVRDDIPTAQLYSLLLRTYI